MKEIVPRSQMYVGTLYKPTLVGLQALRHILYTRNQGGLEAYDLQNDVIYEIRNLVYAYKMRFSPKGKDYAYPLLQANECINHISHNEMYQKLYFQYFVGKEHQYSLDTFLEKLGYPERIEAEEIAHWHTEEMFKDVLMRENIDTTLAFSLSNIEKKAHIQKRLVR